MAENAALFEPGTGVLFLVGCNFLISFLFVLPPGYFLQCSERVLSCN